MYDVMFLSFWVNGGNGAPKIKQCTTRLHWVHIIYFVSPEFIYLLPSYDCCMSWGETVAVMFARFTTFIFLYDNRNIKIALQTINICIRIRWGQEIFSQVPGTPKILKIETITIIKMWVRKIYQWGAWEPYLPTRLVYIWLTMQPNHSFHQVVLRNTPYLFILHDKEVQIIFFITAVEINVHNFHL